MKLGLLLGLKKGIKLPSIKQRFRAFEQKRKFNVCVMRVCRASSRDQAVSKANRGIRERKGSEWRRRRRERYEVEQDHVVLK